MNNINNLVKIMNYYKRIIVFGSIGAYVFMQDMFLTWFLTNIIKFHVYFGVTISYFFAISAHFSLNYLFTFKHRRNKMLTTMLKYLIVVVVNYLLTVTIIFLILNYILNNILFAKFIAVIVTFIVSYTLMNTFAFKASSIDHK